MSYLNDNPLNLLPRETYSEIPLLSKELINDREQSIVYAHLYGLAGDWFIIAISNDGKEAYGYKDIRVEKEWDLEEWFPNQKKWGNISIENLQKLVRKKFIQEKDIRFLISRDLDWSPQPFSKIKTCDSTLKYPGVQKRNK